MTAYTSFIDVDKALELMGALVAIQASIDTTNNGKLMTARINDPKHRKLVPELVALGTLKYATFMEARDSVANVHRRDDWGQ